MERLAKVASPPAAACVVVPPSDPPPGFVPIAIVTFAVDVVRFPYWATMATVTAGAIAVPATALLGCWTKASAFGAPALTLNAVLVALVNPDDEATSV